jgi:hypothetical protein
MNEHQKSGRQAIRLLFFFIISMALTRSLMILFTPDNIHFKLPQFEMVFLYCVFLSFIFRFCLGGYRVLSQDIDVEIRYLRVVIDAIFFVLQALLFYVYSLTYTDIYYALWMLAAICGLDLLWLIIMALYREIGSSTFIQWLIHDVFFIGGISFVIFLGTYQYSIFMYWLGFFAFIACVLDIWLNRKFYFSHVQKGLRIFIAGPYGDNQTEEVIHENVRIAKEIGKEIALKGHYPFIPHTMLHGWETDERFTIDDFKKIDYEWLSYCDALYYISSSIGADEERAIAKHIGLRIYKNIEEVPNLNEKINNCKYQIAKGKCYL